MYHAQTVEMLKKFLCHIWKTHDCIFFFFNFTHNDNMVNASFYVFDKEIFRLNIHKLISKLIKESWFLKKLKKKDICVFYIRF